MDSNGLKSDFSEVIDRLIAKAGGKELLQKVNE